MSDTFDHSALPDDELLAAEYALGVLEGAERAGAERRIAHERAFAAMVAQWQKRLAPWAGEIADVAPRSQVWERILAQLPAQAAPRPPLWQNLRFWRRFAFASGALASARSSISAASRASRCWWPNSTATASTRWSQR
jgi:anti-sigma-K factor RskA